MTVREAPVPKTIKRPNEGPEKPGGQKSGKLPGQFRVKRRFGFYEHRAQCPSSARRRLLKEAPNHAPFHTRNRSHRCPLLDRVPGGALAEASNAAPQPIGIAIAALDYTDTSGEVNDQRAAHQELLRAFTSALQNDLSASGKYRAVPITCGAEPCQSQADALELQKAAQAAGARLVVIGGVHKMSTLVQWAKIQIVDEDEGRIVFDRSLTFRGDTRLAWERAETFTAREILASSPGFDSAASTSPRVKIAVFDFELEDFSGGSSLIPRRQRHRTIETCHGRGAAADCAVGALRCCRCQRCGCGAC